MPPLRNQNHLTCSLMCLSRFFLGGKQPALYDLCIVNLVNLTVLSIVISTVIPWPCLHRTHPFR